MSLDKDIREHTRHEPSLGVFSSLLAESIVEYGKAIDWVSRRVSGVVLLRWDQEVNY